jgi:FMN-dependent NADH-azoreductase
MATLLAIEASPRSAAVSTELAERFIDHWQSGHEDGIVIRRNVSLEPVPLLDEAWIEAAYTAEADRTPEQRAALVVSDQLVDELIAADTLVIATPMWNLNIPAALKAWIDQIARVDRTFKFTNTAPSGLLSPSKQVVIFTTRGGSYGYGSAMFDYQEPYLRAVLRLLGLRDIRFVHAENQGFSPEVARASRDAAHEWITELPLKGRA